MAEVDHELEVLLSLDGYEFDFARGYRVRFAARRIEPTKGRPYGVKYSLTLHDPAGRRIYGIDNAHAMRRQAVFDIATGIAPGGWWLMPIGGRSSWSMNLSGSGADSAGTRCVVKRKEATFQEFKEFTRAVVRGERAVDPNEPKIWIERVESGERPIPGFLSRRRSRGEVAVGEKPCAAQPRDRREQAAIRDRTGGDDRAGRAERAAHAQQAGGRRDRAARQGRRPRPASGACRPQGSFRDRSDRGVAQNRSPAILHN